MGKYNLGEVWWTQFPFLAIMHPSGKYLQVYDERWKCWLFPYYRTEDPNKENIDRHASCLIKMKVIRHTNCINIHYIGMR